MIPIRHWHPDLHRRSSQIQYAPQDAGAGLREDLGLSRRRQLQIQLWCELGDRRDEAGRNVFFGKFLEGFVV